MVAENKFTSSSGGLIAFFAANPVAANLIKVFLILAGLIVGSQLAIQSWPEFTPRTIMVTVPSPGSTADEIYEDINRRIEVAIVGINGVSRVASTARENVGHIEITLETFADNLAVLEDVANAVGALERFPPISADRPEIELVHVSDPVMTIALYSQTASEDVLRSEAEELQSHLLNLPNVTIVEVSGSRDREISIELNEVDLQRHGLNYSTIAQAINANSINFSLGDLHTTAGVISLKVLAKKSVGDDFRNIPIIERLDGSVILLEDVATIRDSFVDDPVITELDGLPAIYLRVDASSDQSIRDIRNTVKNYLNDYKPAHGVNQVIWEDNVTVKVDRLRSILSNGAIGILLVFLCLVAVFDLRSAFWITLGIPLSFIGSLAFFPLADLTLNIGTLVAFFLLIGIVVDDSVVVGESIISQRKKGITGLEASISGARMVFGPLFVGAITTLMAFMPLIFVDVGAWRVVNVIPIVVAIVLAISLIEAFLLLPAHLANDKPWSAPPLSNWQRNIRQILKRLRDTVVTSTASWAIRNSWMTILLAVILLIGSIMLLRYDSVPIVLGDGQEGSTNTIRVEIILPSGTPFGKTEKVVEHIREAGLLANRELDGKAISSISTVVGSIFSNRPEEDDNYGENIAMVYAQLYNNDSSIAELNQIKSTWKKFIGKIDQAEKIEFISTQIDPIPNVAYSLRHDSIEIMEMAAAEIQKEMRTIPGIYDISDNLKKGNRHFEIQLTPEGIAAGFTPATLGAQIRSRLYGIEAQRIQRGHEELKVVINYPIQNRGSVSDLSDIRVVRPGGGKVPLSAVASITEKRDLYELARLDNHQVVYVNAKADLAIITPRRARNFLESEVIKNLSEQYPGLLIERDGAALNEQEIVDLFKILVPLTLLAIYLLMAAFLRSYWKPIISVAGIPMAFVGAVLAHWILGWNFTFMSIFGVVAVSGVVVNDGLVLLDRYGWIRKENPTIPAIAAVVSATRLRFRPVLLTSLTTVLGLLPLLYERSSALQFIVPFVTSMLGGLILSGLFVLFLMPSMVMIVEGKHE